MNMLSVGVKLKGQTFGVTSRSLIHKIALHLSLSPLQPLLNNIVEEDLWLPPFLDACLK